MSGLIQGQFVLVICGTKQIKNGAGTEQRRFVNAAPVFSAELQARAQALHPLFYRRRLFGMGWKIQIGLFAVLFRSPGPLRFGMPEETEVSYILEASAVSVMKKQEPSHHIIS